MGAITGTTCDAGCEVLTIGYVNAVAASPNMMGVYMKRDARFITLAKDLTSHRGYQTWHRQLDAEMVTWLEGNPTASPRDFERYLDNLYGRQDLLVRFPKGLGK